MGGILKAILLGILWCAISQPAIADDPAFGHRLAACSGTLEAWSAVLKETESEPRHQRTADRYAWKSIRLKKRALNVIDGGAFRETSMAASRHLIRLVWQNDRRSIGKAVDACELFYERVII